MSLALHPSCCRRCSGACLPLGPPALRSSSFRHRTACQRPPSPSRPSAWHCLRCGGRRSRGWCRRRSDHRRPWLPPCWCGGFNASAVASFAASARVKSERSPNAVRVQDEVLVLSGLVLGSSDRRRHVYRFIFLLECAVETKGLVRLPTPLKHPVEATAM